MQAKALIGPNAILQLVDVLEARGLGDMLVQVLHRAGVARPRPDAPMLPQQDCAAVHRALRDVSPGDGPALLRAAGLATGDYILAHRIPALAQRVLRVSPPRLSVRMLSAAIARHAWTFAGTGQFSVAGHAPLTFMLQDNPLVAGLRADVPQCIWHASVFERLFARLVCARVKVRETACCACGDVACRFEVTFPRVP